jgi:hypothetical protein
MRARAPTSGPVLSGLGSVADRIVMAFLADREVSFQPFSLSLMPWSCSSAVSRLSTISRARIAGSGRLSESSKLSSLSQKMSRLAYPARITTISECWKRFVSFGHADN